MQDRYVAELALAGVKTIATANRMLQEGFMEKLNQKFGLSPLEPLDFHRPVPASVDLADVFCFEAERTLANDWTIRHDNRYYQIARDNKPLPRPKDKILMRWRLDGELILLYKGTPLRYETLTPRQYEKASHKTPVAEREKPAPSGKGSPWRQNCSLMFAEPNAQ